MVLVWELNFIRNTNGDQKIMFTRTFENGLYKDYLSELNEEKIIFLNYVSLFPAKDIVRIKLGLHGHFLYSFYYIDKSTLESGFLGVFGVQEYNENSPFDWPETEFIAKYVFAEYFKRLKNGRLITAEGSQEYLTWLNDNIQEYFDEFLEAKQENVVSKSEDTKNSLLNAFQSAAQTTEKKEAEKVKEKLEKKTRRASRKEKKMDLNFGSEQPKSRPKLKEIISIKEQDIIIENIGKEDKIWTHTDRKFEFMLINTYGNPLTKIMAFINGEQKDWGTEEEQNNQSLVGMTYSVLKSFVEQQNLSLQNMTVRKKDGQGFEFILFHSFAMGEQSYLIIMNVDNHDTEKGISIGDLYGNEELILTRIATELKENEEWFDEKGEFKSREISFEVESIFYRESKKAFM
jgi:hypothetical protein